MRLHDLKPRPGAKHPRKRLGQGESSGHGKTSGRGGKGQTARSGSSIRIGFEGGQMPLIRRFGMRRMSGIWPPSKPMRIEGGQMPLIRRIPKRGFNNARFTTRYLPVNVEALNCFDEGTRVDEPVLRERGLVN